MNSQWHWAMAAPWWVKSCSWIDSSQTIWSFLLFDGVPKHTGSVTGKRICRAFVCGKICHRQRDSMVMSFQLLLDLLLCGYHSHAGALWRKCLMLLQSFSGKSGADLLAYQSAVNRDLSKTFLLLKLGGDPSVSIAALKKSEEWPPAVV